MPQIAAAPASNYEHEHLPDDAPEAVARLQYFPEDDRAPRPVGAEPEDEERFAALMQTDMRQAAEIGGLRMAVTEGNAQFQAELNELREHVTLLDAGLDDRADTVESISERVKTLEINFKDDHDWLAQIANSVLVLEHPVEEAHPYNFKALQELAWAVGTVIVTVLLQALADVENVTDWKAWAIGVGAACLRAVLGLILAQGHVTSGVEPTSHVPTSGGVRHS